MTLTDINKDIYRKHLNVVIVSFVLGFAILSLAIGQLLISQFGSAIEGESNFTFNLIGVAIGLAISAFILSRCRQHPYFKEIYYVWQLKQLQNAIYRKVAKIKPKAMEGDVTALQIMDFYYRSLAQVYQLDNNTLTIKTVQQSLDNIVELSEKWSIELDIEAFSKDLVAKF